MTPGARERGSGIRLTTGKGAARTGENEVLFCQAWFYDFNVWAEKKTGGDVAVYAWESGQARVVDGTGALAARVAGPGHVADPNRRLCCISGRWTDLVSRGRTSASARQAALPTPIACSRESTLRRDDVALRPVAFRQRARHRPPRRRTCRYGRRIGRATTGGS